MRLAVGIFKPMQWSATALSLSIVLAGCFSQGGSAVDSIIGEEEPAADIGRSAVVFDPTSVNFGNTPKSPSFLELSIKLTNTAPKPIFIDGFVIDNTEFTVSSHNCAMAPLQLDAGSECSLVLRFSPVSDGDHTGTLKSTYGLANDTKTDYSVDLGLAGRATADGVGNAGLSFSPSSWDFGDVALSPSYLEKTFTVTNVTEGPLYIAGFSSNSSLYTITTSSCPIVPDPFAKDATCSVTVRFSPAAVGVHSAKLSGVYGTSDLVPGAFHSDATLSGRSTSAGTGNAAITFSPNYWNYGHVALSGTTSKVITVTNSSSATVYMGSLGIDPASTEFNFVGTTCPLGLNPFASGQSCLMTLSFAPTSEGAKTATVVAEYGPDAPRRNDLSTSIVLAGRSDPAPVSSSSLTLTPSFFDYGDVARNQAVTHAFTVTNVSPGTLYVGSIDRTSPATFTVSHNCGATLAPTASCVVNVIYLPTADGSYSSDVTINYGPSLAANTSVQGKIVVIGRSTSNPIGNATLEFSPSFWDFGDIAVGQSSLKGVTLSNTGTVPVYMAALTSNNTDFQVSGSTCPSNTSTPLNNGASCTFNLRFIPSAQGVSSADITASYGLELSRNNNLSHSMAAAGRSDPAGAGNSAFSFDPNYHDFGDVAAGLTVLKGVTVTNSSASPVYISNITRTNSAIFNVSHDCPVSPSPLAAGATCMANVSFSPTADGSQASLISILFGPDAPRSADLVDKFAVSGRSTAATRGNSSVTYTPDYWDFGDVPANTSQSKAFTVRNVSSSSIYLGGVSFDSPGSFLITGNTCPNSSTAMLANATCTVTVRFSPTADTIENVTMRTLYGPDTARSSNLAATAIISGRSKAVPPGQAVFTVSPDFKDFGDVAQGNSVSQVFTVTNASGGDIYFSNVTRSNTSAYTVGDTCPRGGTALANAGTCTVTVAFSPVAEGAASTRIDLLHGLTSSSSSNLTFSFYAQGRSTAAANGNASLTFAPTSKDFGNIAAGSNSVVGVTVTNSSSSSVYLGGVTVDNSKFTITSNLCPASSVAFASGASCVMNVRFAPTAEGVQDGSLIYRYGPDTARSGNLLAPMSVFGRSEATAYGTSSVTFTPSSYDYGDVADGQTSTATFTVRNIYTSPIYISSFTSSDAHVTLSDDCARSPTGLAANATCTLTAVFAPTADGAYSSDLKIHWGIDAPRSANLETLLTVTGRSTAVSRGNPSLSFTPTYKDFGNLLVGQNASNSFTVTNLTTSTVHLGGVTTSVADYAVTGNTCGATLTNGSNCTVTVRYTPDVEETDIAELRYSYGPDNARRTNQVVIGTLIGKSEPPPVGNAAVVLSPNTHDFGSVALSPAYAEQVISVTNSSTRTLYLDDDFLTSMADPYSVSASDCPVAPSPFAGSATCDITVRFSPTSGPQVTGTMTLRYGVSAGDTDDYNSEADFTGRSNPNPPTNFQFTTGTASSISFSWEANDFDQSSFEIERCTGATCESTFPSSDPVIPGGIDRLTGITNTVRTFTWNAASAGGLSISEGEIYRFRVRGVAGSTKSTWLTGGTTIAFGGLTSVDNSTGLSTSLSSVDCDASSAGSYVGLYWNSVANAKYYQVVDIESGSQQIVKNVDAPASSVTLTGITSLINKTYLVKAFTVSGVGSVNTTGTALQTVRYTPCAAFGQTSQSALDMSSGFFNPRAMWIDTTTTPKRMFVADQANHRVLIWNSIPTNYNVPADVVLGQPDFDSRTANNSGVRTAPAARSAKSMNTPMGVFAKGGKLYVSDSGNHRVLIWNSIPTENFTAADVVVGQANFTTATAVGTTNCTTLNSARVMNAPRQVFVDNANAMYVADSGNHRILVWNTIPTTNYANADVALGDNLLTTCPSASRTQSTFSGPENLYVSNNDVFVSDRGNRRVMRFVKPLTTGMNASHYWGGHADFASLVGWSCVDTKFNDPIGIWGDDVAGSTNIWVADYGGHRTVRIPSASFASNNPAFASVLGQANLTSCAAADTAVGVRNPISGFSYDSTNPEGGIWMVSYAGHRIHHTPYLSGVTTGTTADFAVGQPRFGNIFSNVSKLDGQHVLRPMGISVGNSDTAPHTAVADYSANRVLLYDAAITGHLPAANRVLGQTTFTGATANQGSTVSSSTLSAPAGVWTDGVRLLVADSGNHRVLGWRTWPTADAQAASFVLGQTLFTGSGAGASNAQVNAPIGVFSSDVPGSMTFDYIWVAESGNNRVTAYQTTWSTSPADPFNGQSAVLVLGQAGWGTNTAATTQTGLRNPRSVWSNGARVVVADTMNHRVMIWDTGSTPSSGDPATIVLGQPTFLTNTVNINGLSAGTMSAPSSVFVDSSGRLYVADNGNHRILVWDTFPTTDGQEADRVIGQSSFLANTLNSGLTYPLSKYFYHPVSLWLDAGRVFVSDGLDINNIAPNTSTNNRVTVFPGF